MNAQTISVRLIGIDGLSGPFKGATSAITGIESAAGRAGGALVGLAGTIVKLGAAAAAAGLAGLAAVLTASVKAASDFSTTLSAVGAVTKATADQMELLRKKALDIGKDTAIAGISASDAAKGMEALGKAGVSVEDQLGGAARAAALLASAGGVDVVKAAELASNALNQFNLKGADMERVADLIAGAANASAIDVNDFGLSLQQVGAVANLVGLSFDDTATAIALMGQAGIKGSDAGTSLKTMLMNLNPVTDKQTKLFRELGIITGDGANRFFDASGKAKGLADIAGVLQTATKGMTDQQKLATLEMIFGSDAIRAAAVLTKAGADGFRNMAKASAEMGGAAEVGRKRVDNLSGDIEQFKASVETAAIQLGTYFLPGLRNLTKAATGAVNAAGPMIEAYGPKLGDAFTRATERVVALRVNLAPLIATASGLVTAFGAAVPAAIDMATAAYGRLREIIGGLFESGIDAYATGWQTLGNTIKQAMEIAGPPVKALADVWVNNLVENFIFMRDQVIPPLLSILGQTWTFLEQNIFPTVGRVGTVFRTVLGESLLWLSKDVWPLLLNIAGQVWGFFIGRILPEIQPLAAALREVLGAALGWLAKDVFPALLLAAGKAIDWLKGDFSKGVTAAAGMIREGLGAAMTWLSKDVLPFVWNAIVTVSNGFMTVLLPALRDLWNEVKGPLGAALTWLWEDALPAVGGAIVGASNYFMTVLLPAVRDVWNEVKGPLSEALTTLWQDGLPAVGQAAGDLAREIQNLWAWITNDLWPAMKDRGATTSWLGAWESIKELAKVVGDLFKDPLQAGVAGANGELDRGTPAARGMADAIKALGDVVWWTAEGWKNLIGWLVEYKRIWGGQEPGSAGAIWSEGAGLPPTPPVPGPTRGGPIVAPPAARPATGENAPGAAVGGMKYGAIDNSSRESFVRTAWPYMLEAAGGNADLAQSMLGIAISEQGDIGGGGGFIGNNFFGIKAVGDQPYVTAMSPEGRNAERVEPIKLRAYPDPVSGMGGFMQFLRENPRYAGALKRFEASGDASQLVRDIHAEGYAEDVNWPSKIESYRKGQVEPVVGNLPKQLSNIETIPGIGGGGALQIPPQVSQFGSKLMSYDEMSAACGPAAAAWFAQITGRTTTLEEATALAREVGWTKGAGMAGPASEVALLGKLGVSAVANQFDPEMARQTAMAGIPQIFSSAAGGGKPGHYWQTDAYNPETGEFHVGASGTRATGEWATIAEMEAAMGPLTQIITLTGQSQESLTRMGQAGGAAAEQVAGGFVDLQRGAVALSGEFSRGEVGSQHLGRALLEMAANSGVSVRGLDALNAGTMTTDQALTDLVGQLAETHPEFAALRDQIALNEATNMTYAGSLSEILAASAGSVVPAIANMSAGAADLQAQMAAGTLTFDEFAVGLTTVARDAGLTAQPLADLQVGLITNEEAVLRVMDALAEADPAFSAIRDQFRDTGIDSVGLAKTIMDKLAGSGGAIPAVGKAADAAGESTNTLRKTSKTGWEGIAETIEIAALAMIKAVNSAAASIIAKMAEVDGTRATVHVDADVRAAQNAVNGLLDDIEEANTLSKSIGKKTSKRHGGGAVIGGQPYIVGGLGAEELFVPGVSGIILPPDQTERALRSRQPFAMPAGSGGHGHGGGGGETHIHIHVSAPNYLGREEDVARKLVGPIQQAIARINRHNGGGSVGEIRR